MNCFHAGEKRTVVDNVGPSWRQNKLSPSGIEVREYDGCDEIVHFSSPIGWALIQRRGPVHFRNGAALQTKLARARTINLVLHFLHNSCAVDVALEPD